MNSPKVASRILQYFFMTLIALAFIPNPGANAYMNKKSADLSSIGLSVKILSELEIPAKHQFRLWTMDKNFLTDKSIAEFHDFCGSDEVNKFVHFLDQSQEDEDYTRNCSYSGDLILVNTTFRTLPDPEEGVIMSYKIVDIVPFVSNEGGRMETCKIQNFGDHEFGLMGGIITRTNVDTGKSTTETTDIPESIFNTLLESIVENYIYYRQEDVEEDQADHVNKDCIDQILTESGVEQVKESCQVTCKPFETERIEL